MKIKVEKQPTQSQINKVVTNEASSKSAKMKDLFTLGLSIKEIATTMDVRYNFVYNVISNHVTINGIEVESNKQSSKKDEIIKLHLEGKSNKEISAELKANYQYVYNTLKKYKSDHPVEEAI